MIDEHFWSVAGLAVAGIVWLVRLEAKANQSQKDVISLKEYLEDHVHDRTIHHNADAFTEFEKRIDLQFTHLSDGLKKVEGYIEDIDKKIERYLNEQ